MGGFGFSQKDAKRIANVVTTVEGVTKPSYTVGGKPALILQRRVQGKLDETLDAATAIDDPETAEMSVWSGVGDDFAETDETLTITNRDTSLSLSSGTYVKVEFINGEWSIYWAGCGGD